MSDIKIGIEIETIGNGYLVTAHKTNGWSGASADKMYYADLTSIENDLVGIVRKAGDLVLEDTPQMINL